MYYAKLTSSWWLWVRCHSHVWNTVS